MAGKSVQRFIEVGGRRLAMREAGSGVPPVVLEMGLGAAGNCFDMVAERLAAITRTVWYDRANLGQSDPAPTPRTIADFVGDLHALLAGADIAGPYVLVGHSLGGLTVRLYRERFPATVAAVVLVDAAHEDQQRRLLDVLPPEQAEDPAALARLRLALSANWADPRSNDEGIDNVADTALMGRCDTLGTTPLVVISRGRSDRDPALFPPGVVERLEAVWQTMQRDLARLSTNSIHIWAEGSGHMINQDRPELLVDAIVQLVLRLRATWRC